ncbi:hypothetical protein HanRHA438_Chr09g0380351 [Helianthus annuus]|nr:hypothetical protein HanHA89_Chr09g0323281 [Helianthus annuus]KAJ0710197.1 hypothetical protein HanOQP8_Chr09g0309561 [Helianthus annuus]KAJ0886519.1 hypothetical protein HanRHA438_Chr09g0380351 [Helianthus annuus]
MNSLRKGRRERLIGILRSCLKRKRDEADKVLCSIGYEHLVLNVRMFIMLG